MARPPSVAVLLVSVVFVFALAERQADGQKSVSCPLTDTQVQKSIDAFAKIAAFVTNEPRCVNCHGGVNPYIKDTGLDPADKTAPLALFIHGGGVILRKNEKSPDGVKLLDSECDDCHNNMKPRRDGSKSFWTNAANFHSFVDKDATTLCRQFKSSSRNADDFLGHLKDDNGGNNFAGTAFLGNRGLDHDRYDKLVEFQPPSLTSDQFMKLAHDWIDAMGGQFRGDEGCGCEFTHPKWSGQIHYIYNQKGDEGHNEAQTWSNSSLIQITVTVTNGVGTAVSHGLEEGMTENRQSIFGGGWKVTDSSKSTSKGSGSSPAEVDVKFYDQTGQYVPDAGWEPARGTSEGVTCIANDCKPFTRPWTVLIQTAHPWGKIADLKDRNHVSGVWNDTKTGLGHMLNGTMITTVTWNLWRSDK